MSGDIDLTEATAAGVETWINGMGTWQSVDHRVRAILTAALPHIREQIAREIESGLPQAVRRREDWIQRQKPDRVLGFTAAIDAIETCARIARGES